MGEGIIGDIVNSPILFAKEYLNVFRYSYFLPLRKKAVSLQPD
jgi:hypothetical protein